MQRTYLELKLAFELFQKAPETLSDPERERVADVASRQENIERAILSTPEASSVMIPGNTVEQRLGELRQRYESDQEMAQDLETLGLDPVELVAAIERDLKVESILDKVAVAVPAVSEIEAEIYYRLHPQAFDRPAARRLRHILITYDTPSEKAKALASLSQINHKLARLNGESKKMQFAEAALRYSQCPTAMDGGQLGTVKHGQLFPELEPASFALEEGETSEILESPMGMHLIYCEEIHPSGMLPFDEVRERVVERLTDQRRREGQRAWIKHLLGKGGEH